MLNEKNKKKFIIVAVIIVLILLIWFIFLNPYLSFKGHEKEVLNGAKRYYEINSTKLPTGSKIRTVSLKTLYEKSFIDTSANSVYATNKCSIEKGFVKVKKENNDYKYYVYLDCGLYKSNVDHEGPKVTLNGNDSVTVNRGDEYKELGVKSVKDDTDGILNPKDVIIDSSKLNTDKNGNYEVTYRIRDSFGNETIKVRNVKVVQTLNHIVEKDTKDGIYKGSTEPRYLKVDEIVFKIVGLNSDNSVKIVANDPLASIDYEGIDTWLNKYFYGKLSDSIKDKIVDSKWCNETVTSTQNYTKCKKYSKKQYVGLLSIIDYNNAKVEDSNYLNEMNEVWTYNKKDKNTSWSGTNYAIGGKSYQESNNNSILGIKPVLNIKKDTSVVSGNGSFENPYRLEGNTKNGKKGEKISSSKVGSYINYSGYIWRVIGKEEDDTTHITMTSSIEDNNATYYTYFDSVSSSYNPKSKTNLGYRIVNDISKYVKTNYFENKEIEVPTYKDNVSYLYSDNIKKYKVKLAATSIFSLFSNETTGGGTSWYRESVSNKKIAYLNPLDDIATKYSYSEMDEYSIRVSGYLQKDIVIKDGDGTYTNPYQLTK